MLDTKRRNENVMENLGERITTLIDELASHDVLKLQHARESLVAVGKPAVPALLHAMQDPNDQVRWEAVRVLSEIRDPTSASALVQALTDQNFVVRWLASEALTSLGRWALTPLLNALIERPDSVWLRRGAHRVLRVQSRGPLSKVLDPVIKALEDIEPTLEVPIAATKALHGLEKEPGNFEED